MGAPCSDIQSVSNNTVITMIASDLALHSMQPDSSNDSHFVTDCPPAHRSSWSEIPRSPNLYGQNSPAKLCFSENMQRRHRRSGSGFSSNKSFPRESELVRMRSKSRLIDPPEQYDNFERIMKSGCIEARSECHYDDPYSKEDFPEEFKMIKFSKWAVIQFFCMIVIIAALVCSRFVNFSHKNILCGLELWRWGILLLALLCGRLVAGWGIRVVVFLVELNCMLRKRVLYFVYGLRRAVNNCLWLALILIAWRFVLFDRVENLVHGKVLSYVTKAWVCLLVGTMIWFVKTLLVKVLASSFHVSTFFDRIQCALFDQYVIETLTGPPLIGNYLEPVEEEQITAEVPQLLNAGDTVPPEPRTIVSPRSGKLKTITKRRKIFPSFKSSRFSTAATKEEKQGITIGHLHRLNRKNISAWNMKRLMNIVRKGNLSTLDEREDETAVQITSETQAKFAAEKIFCNVAKPGSKYGENGLEALENPEWVCPVCRGICNCSLCMNAKGLPPTGLLYRKILKTSNKSVAHYLLQTERQITNLEKEGTKVPLSAKRSLAFPKPEAASMLMESVESKDDLKESVEVKFEKDKMNEDHKGEELDGISTTPETNDQGSLMPKPKDDGQHGENNVDGKIDHEI